jgi:hypothetical protein
MSEFNTGRKIDKLYSVPAEYIKSRAIDYPKEVSQGWKNFFGIGSPKPIGSLDKPVAESVGGLTILPATAVRQVSQGMQKLLKRHSDIGSRQNLRNLEQTTDLFSWLPKETLAPIRDIATVKKLPRTKTGAVDPVGRAQVFSGGSTQITRTPRLTQHGMAHEIIHAYTNAQAKSTKNTTRSKAAKLIHAMKDVSHKAVAKYNEARKGQGVRYSDYRNVNPDEIVARNVTNRLKQARVRNKNSLSYKKFKKLYKYGLQDAIDEIGKKSPTLLRKGKEEVLKKYNITSDKITRKPLTENEIIDSMFGFPMDVTKRFPAKVGSPQEAVALGKQYPVKELNRIMVKEKKINNALLKKAEHTKDSTKRMELFNKSMVHATRHQGAREALESKYIGKNYKPGFKLDKAKFKLWIAKQLR